MWMTSRRQSFASRIRSFDQGGVLDEHTFWQIVKTERERADRSGMPVTIAVFTVREDRQRPEVAAWNAATLCSSLRATARMTDHVGVAGNQEVGVVLWGTRELGAYRFVNRVGEQANKLASDCRLFVYPSVAGQPDDEADKSGASTTPDEPDVLDDTAELDAIDRIAEVENLLAEARDVETPVVAAEDCQQSVAFSFGTDPTDFRPDVSAASRLSSDFCGGTATLLAPLPTNARATRSLPGTQPTDRLVEQPTAPLSDQTLKALLATAPRKAAHSRRASPSDTAPQIDEHHAGCAAQLNVTTEPLENLFLHPHPRWKRAVDVLVSLTGLLVISPLLAAIAVAIRVTSPGPVLFRQTREGHGGRLFTIFKFRTMRVGADAEKARLRAASEQDGPAFKLEADPRVTTLGRFLRKTCLDELPQLWNVLRGDMTLVGPRPLDFRESTKIARWGRRRLHVMPGLTCIWQVHGKSRVTFHEWMRMDIRYAQRVSFRGDVKLVLQTLRQMLLQRASH